VHDRLDRAGHADPQDVAERQGDAEPFGGQALGPADVTGGQRTGGLEAEQPRLSSLGGLGPFTRTPTL
jgi:hypothetical protein